MGSPNKKPPGSASYLLHLITGAGNKESLLGDIEEEYYGICSHKGAFRAKVWYWGHVLQSIPGFIKFKILWSLLMFSNYFKIAFRNLIRHKSYSLINISGLAIGMACCIMILLWVQDELSFDRFHKNSDSIYRVDTYMSVSGGERNIVSTPALLGPALTKDFAEIAGATRLKSRYRMLVRSGENSYFEKIDFADPALFTIFTFPFLKGNPETALTDPMSIIITEQTAKKYFGEDNPLGKTLTVRDLFDFTVSGVIKDVPPNSTIRFDLIVPFNSLEKFGENLKDWGRYDFLTYILLKNNTSINTFEEKTAGYLKKYRPQSNVSLKLQPLKRIHLYGKGGGGDIKSIYIFSTIALIVLLIGCINYINLSTARSGTRAKEICIRKVAGAQRKNLVRQLFGESMLISFLALFLAVGLVELFLPAFREISGKQLVVDYTGSSAVLPGMIFIALIAGIISGSYPALILSSFQIIKVLKGSITSGHKKAGYRKILVVFQFSVSIILIAGALIIYKQISFIKNKDLGYNREHLLYVPMNKGLRKQYNTVKNELIKNVNIQDVTGSDQLTTYMANWTKIGRWEGKKDEGRIRMNVVSVDYNFIKTYGMKILQGRDFSKEFAADKSDGIIVNETAVNVLGMESPVGKVINFWGIQGKIIGVMKDFNFRPLHQKMEPIIFRYAPDSFGYFSIRIKPEDISGTISFIKETCERFAPGYPVSAGFLDDRIDLMYRAEQRTSGLLNYFTALAIFISCLGLFGLASFVAERRTREIGIRKVLGATERNIAVLLSGEFLIWILIAHVIAWPAAYFLMNSWLQNFAYRINIGLLPFVISGVFAILIALFTVGFQAVKASRTNPVDTLKYE